MRFQISLFCLILAVAAAFSPVTADESFVPQIASGAMQEVMGRVSSEMLASPLALADVAARQPSANPIGNVAEVIQVGTANSALVTQSGAGNTAFLMQQGANNSAVISQSNRSR